MNPLIRLVLAMIIVSTGGLAGSALAHTYEVSGLTIDHPWSRATPPRSPNGAGYMTITNEGPADDRLVGATSPVAGRVELHTHAMDGNVMRMRKVNGGVRVPAGEAVTFKPGGLHVMFLGLNDTLEEGEWIPLTLTFEKAGTLEVELYVHPLGYAGPEAKADNPGDTHHDGH
ncbi:MAG: copper chaperone PCu(A)C [Pseudomonadota bacterium]